MAGFSIVTNINSLIAQENLGKTNVAQQRTIQRLTSGLRINSSADDAAGLAVANRFRSDIAVLQQGVRNAADGLSTLQTIDGGLNNVSLLLDRGRTLATQSASGTFTGDRNALNSEFQSVIEEINRQAQSIGLDPGGQFNAALQVFIGGGRANNGISETTNGAVSIDLTDSAVSGSRLGLEGVRALGGVEGTTDIGATSTTSVESIVGNAANQASQTTAGFTEFVFSGPGFADDGKAKLAVNLAGVVDASTLATAINDAVAGFSSTSAAGESFKNAGIKAVINTDTNGGKQLAFTSSDTAFQVKAGDLTSNALLGNYVNSATDGEGSSLTLRVQSGTASGDASVGNTDTIVLKVSGGALTAPQTVSITLAGSETQAQIFSALETAFNADSTLVGSGFRIATDSSTDNVQVYNDNGNKFSVLVSGDSENVLGFGSAVLGASNVPAASTYSGTGAIDVSVSGTASVFALVEGSGATTPQQIDVTVTAGVTTQQDVVDQINAAINVDGTLSAAGLKATLGVGNVLELGSASGTTFQLSVDDSNANNILQLGDAGGGVVDGAALVAGTNFGSAGANIAGVSLDLDYDGTVGTDATIEATLNEGYVGGAVTAADAGETITFTITNNRTGSTTATISVNVLNTDDSDDLENSIGAAIDSALGANVLEVTNGAGGAAAGLEFAVGAAANDADSFTINSFTSTANGAFDSGIVNGTNIDLDAVTETRLADKLNAAVAANGAVAATGLHFVADTGAGAVDVTSGQDLSFTATDTATGSNIGDFVSGLATVSTDAAGGGLLTGFSSVEQGTFLESTVNAGGAQSTSGATVDDPSTFQALAYGNDIQNLSIAVKDSAGAVQTLNVALNHGNALTIDEAVNAINDQLQQSNNSTLQGLLAVKERIDGSTDGIRLLGGADTEFSLNASGLATGNGVNGGTAETLTSKALDGGSVADISSRENAENAVTLLAAAVSTLGTLQANVGRGQNRLQFAIGLATTQVTNLAAAESRIRDADLAAEAANLTRTSIAQQAGVAALAQANSAPQAVLALLRG